jgi:hypothetical protein
LRRDSSEGRAGRDFDVVMVTSFHCRLRPAESGRKKVLNTSTQIEQVGVFPCRGQEAPCLARSSQSHREPLWLSIQLGKADVADRPEQLDLSRSMLLCRRVCSEHPESGEEQLENRRTVGLAVADREVDGRRCALQRPADDGPGQQISRIGGHER